MPIITCHISKAGKHCCFLALTSLLASFAWADDYLLVSRTEANSNYQYQASPEDWRDVNIYQLFTDRFFDGDSSNNKTGALDINRDGWFVDGHDYPSSKNYHHGGDWTGLKQKLDYLDNLGVNAIWISGVQMNAQGRDTRFTPYHQYHPTDFWRCDPVSGTFQELQDLIDDCHSRGMYVILDVVINHMADLAGLPYSNDDQQYWSNGNESYTWWGSGRHRGAFNRLDWFHHNGTINNWDASPENLLGQFKGTDDLATEREDVQNELDLAFKNLISATDCDGFRVDAIKHVEYNWCKKWADDMRKHAASLGKNDFILFGELFSYDNGALASYCNDDGYSFNSALFFPMANTIKSVFKEGSGTGQLTSQRNNIDQYGEGADRLVAFIDNHDVNRISLEMGGDINDDVAKLKPAMTFLYTAMPVPLLYYGTEHCFDQGGHYNLADGAEDGDHQRECMFNKGFQPGPAFGDKFEGGASPLYSHIAAINHARKNHKSLTRGSFAERWQEGSAGAYAYLRKYNEEESLVAFNTAYDSRSITPSVDKPDGTVFVNVLNESETATVSGGQLSFSLNGKESKIFVAGQSSSLSIHNTYNWPADGGLDVGEELWINVEALPKGSITNAFVVYSDDGGTTWSNVLLEADARVVNYDGWHINLGSFSSGVTIQYSVAVQDAATELWDNNGGDDYRVTVNAGGTPAVVDWTPATPSDCIGSTVDITYQPNDGPLSAAAAIELVYGFFFQNSTNWASAAMTLNGDTWEKTLSVPSDCEEIQIVFNDTASVWDNHDGANWSIPVSVCSGSDTDEDGMSDAWEEKYGFNKLLNDADSDFDQDGFSNRKEYIAGTNPNDPTSILELTANFNAAGTSLTIPVAEPGRTYTLLRSTNLVSGFEVVYSNLVGVVPELQITDLTADALKTAYYRLQAAVPSGNIAPEHVSVFASPAGGTFSDPSGLGIPVTLHVSGITVISSTYTLQGGGPTSFSDGDRITFGIGMSVGDYQTLTLNGATESGITDQKLYIFNKADPAFTIDYTGGIAMNPVTGELDAGEDLTISFETSPIGAGLTAGLVYSSDGTTWSSGSLTKGTPNSSNDIWSVNIGSFSEGQTVQFALVVEDSEGQTWDNNGGVNYSIQVNGGTFVPGPSKPYSTNPTLGQRVSNGAITADGSNNDEWDDSKLIALDMANDDPRTLGDNWTTHEAPIDLTHLWAAWDDNNLYLAWQYVDVTDTIDGANAGGAGSGQINHNDGILQWIALDTKNGGASLDVWGKNNGSAYWTGSDLPDVQIYMAGSLWQGYLSRAVNGVFAVDDGGVNYFTAVAAGVSYGTSDSFQDNELWGNNETDNRFDAGAPSRDFLSEGHDTTRDSFYEIAIPLITLQITAADIESSGLGIMLAGGSESAMDSIPHDEATLDTPGVETYNSSFEWGDTDHFSAPFARIGAVK